MTKLTIHQIATLAGVSIGTVSRVINHRPGVNAHTRQQVLEVVQRMGFVPDASARKLARGARGLIGVAPFSAHASYSPYFSILLDGIQETLMANGYAARALEPHPSAFAQVAGFIVPGIQLDDSRLVTLEQCAVPTVVVGRLERGSWVAVDNPGGMAAAMQHLLRLGHRRIAHLTGSPIIAQETFDRLEAYHHALSGAGLPDDPALIFDGFFTELGGYRAVRSALERGLQFSAVAAASDEMAHGAILALQDGGLRVPYDVSVTGFDDLPFTQRFEPQLTSVHQPIHTLGHRAAEALLAQLEGQTPPPQTLPTELIVRASSGPAPRSRG